MPRHTPAPFFGHAALSLALVTLVAAPAAAQSASSTRTASTATERYDDPVGNGICLLYTSDAADE